MKGEEYTKPNKGNNTNATTDMMFSKLNEHQIQPYSPTAPCTTKSDGATIETSRRPRGRPPGSKNKPKPPIIITREPSEPPMSPYVLEVSPGADVIESVAAFSKRRALSLSLLAASGPVANVTLRQPGGGGGPAPSSVTFHGRFEVLSLSGTVGLDPALSGLGLRVVIAGPQGQVVGGVVAGPLLAASTVYVVAASVNRAEFVRLPEDEEVRSSGGEEREAAAVERWGGDVAVWAPSASHY